ncbi:MAG: hypothetical protein CBB68_08790 [Rhodospirillaceae bacterium TMED8]|nr:hypothetical protein [Magnetovibrio sp.]OUT50459.1 MAG: hypothetical protein CBB68_08790 [Rhodospirillaceae bacterium TMED8]|tara:strand:+ start:3130 stop:3576 length:447 start_codon:yes stop_codon:yes gene_type:complete
MNNQISNFETLSIIVYDCHFDKVHYALVLAAAAAALNRPVTLFFTMQACRALLKPNPEGNLGWTLMPLSSGLGTGADCDKDFARKKIATFEELLGACSTMGVRFLVCEMGLKATSVTRESLRNDITIEEGGAVTFLGDVNKTGAVLFI